MKDRSALTPLLVLVLLAGVAVGFALGDRYRTANPVALPDPPGMDAAYENSLRGYVVLLDQLSARGESESMRQAHASDKALLLIRLADLAEKRGSSAESTRLTTDALTVCSTGGLPYCSSVELRQRAEKLDRVPESVKQAK